MGQIDIVSNPVPGTDDGKILTARAGFYSLESLPLGELYGQSGSVGARAATFDRYSAVFNHGLTQATSGTLRLYAISLPKGFRLFNIAFWSGTAALVAGTNQWFGLFDSALAVLAKTADDTNTAWAATSKKILAIANGPFVTTYSGIHYVGILIAAGTVPNIAGISAAVLTGARAAALVPGGDSTVGLTTPASCTGTQTAITVLTQFSYAELS